ncbi:TPA: outer membrane beta-barrel protein [Legionella pneumophila]
MKSFYRFIAVVCFGYAHTVFACSNCETPMRWGFSGSIGLTHYDASYHHDGNSAMGRLSINAQYAFSDFFALGLEVGGQSGNTMRLDLEQSTLDELGGEPVSLLIKPAADLLFTAQITPFDESGFYGVMKAGVAFRQAQVNRNDVNDLSQTSPEIQAGMGYKLNDNLAIHLTYQQIFGGNPNYQINPVTETATINDIPTQKTLMLGVSLII